MRIRYVILASLTLALAAGHACGTGAPAGPFYVSDLYAGTLHVLRDLNSDGDALDAGERLLWADGLGYAADAVTDGRFIYVTDSANNVIRRLCDINGDGDALDVGESIVWADLGPGPYPGGLASGPGGVVYATHSGGVVLRLADLNGDGDALDTGESIPYADGLDCASPLLLQRNGTLLTGSQQMHRLADLNGDSDALDTGENVLYTPAPGTPDRQVVTSCLGLLGDGSDGAFASSGDTIYRVRDLTGDGDAMDLVEVLSYADAVYGGIGGPRGLAPYPGGPFLVADDSVQGVCLVRDSNGDGDALDLGEAVLYADAPGNPQAVVNLPDPGTFGYNNVTLVAGDGNWNMTWDAPFVSYGDDAALGTQRLAAALADGATSVSTGAGGYNREAGDLTLATPLDYDGSGPSGLELRACGNVAIAAPISSATPYDDGLALRLVADAEGDNTGQIEIHAPVVNYSGTVTASGTDFWLTSGGIWAAAAEVACPGQAYVMSTLSATSVEVVASTTRIYQGGNLECATGTVTGDLQVDDGGRILCAGGTLDVASPGPWSQAGEIELADATLTGSPVQLVGGMIGRGTSTVSTDVEGVAAPWIDCPDAADHLFLDGAFALVDFASLTKSGDGTLTIRGPQDHGVDSWLWVGGGIVNLDSDAGATGADLSLYVETAVVHFGHNQHLDALEIGPNGQVVFSGASEVVVNELIIAGMPLGPATLTPEPATLALVAAGGVPLLGRRRLRG